MAHSIEEALTLAERIGYPVIVRPSFVIGGLAIDFCYSPDDLARQLAAATVVDPDRPVRIDRYLEGVEVDVDAVSDGERVLIPGLLEHVERAGVHSGDSVGIFPPQTVSDGDQALIVATMERIVLALGARGLVNAQFIVRDDGVYLIEVNPRASRTVPFMSKVTGVPMVELAVRISLGATLPGAGLGRRPPPAAGVRGGQGAGLLDGQAARRGPVGRPGDAVDRRGHRHPHGPARRAGQGAARRRARPAATGRGGRAGPALDRRPRQGNAAAAWPTPWPAPATGWRRRPGRARRWLRPGYEARPVAKLGEAPDEAVGEVPILELIASGEVRLVVNTPTPRSGAVRDAAEIRLAATAEGILCLTAMETAVAAAEALDPDDRRPPGRRPLARGMGAESESRDRRDLTARAVRRRDDDRLAE